MRDLKTDERLFVLESSVAKTVTIDDFHSQMKIKASAAKLQELTTSLLGFESLSREKLAHHTERLATLDSKYGSKTAELDMFTREIDDRVTLLEGQLDEDSLDEEEETVD